jgi:mannosyltransferase
MLKYIQFIIMKNIFARKRSLLGLEVSDWWFIVGGLVIFATLSLITIVKSSFWFDEAFGAYMIRFNFIDIARYTGADVHPPVYYWLLKLWSLLFGSGELALRSFSVFFGGIAIFLGYVLVKRLFNKNAARISLLFMVISPLFIRYSQEARMYTLVAAIAMGATLVLTYAVKSKKKAPWVWYGILVGLGMWVHYFAAIVWIAHWVWHADNVRRIAKKGEFWRKLFDKNWKLSLYVAIGVFLPWLPIFVVQSLVVQVAGFWIPPVTPGTPLNFMTNVIYYLDLGETTGWLTLGFVTLLLAIGVLAFRVYKSLGKDEQQSYRLILALAFVPMILLFAISMVVRSMFIDRYLITSALAIAMFIGITLAYGHKILRVRWRYAIVGLAVVMMGFGIYNVYRLGNYNKNTHESNQTRQIVQAAMKQAKPGEPIIAVTPWIFYEEIPYETNQHKIYFIKPTDYRFGSLDMLKYSDAHKIEDISQFAKEHPTVWYVGWIGQGDLKAPYSNWKELRQIVINDPIDNKPQYKAIEYKIN